MKISEYPAITNVAEDNIFLVDGNDGTKKIGVADAFLAALHLLSPNNHRNIIRGKNLGTALTTAQRTAIQNGSFEDLWLGDYWVINGVTWRIADFDYWYNCGDEAFAQHHVNIMPDNYLYTAKMNDTAVTTGAYVGSDMYTTGMNDAKSMVNNAFGDAVLSHRDFLTTAVTDGHASAGEWYDSTVELPNEIMVYGSHIVTEGGSEVKRHTINKTQLALFANCPKFITIRQAYWLRDVASATAFAHVDYRGSAQYGNATLDYGVRPVFAIG